MLDKNSYLNKIPFGKPSEEMPESRRGRTDQIKHMRKYVEYYTYPYAHFNLSLRECAELFNCTYQNMSAITTDVGIKRSKEDAQINFLVNKHVYSGRGSLIEQSLVDHLRFKGLEVVPQFRIPGYTFKYDIYVPSKNLIIEVDGVYWHCLEEYSNRDNVKEVHAYDKIRTEVAISCGYKICRVTDSHLNSRIDSFADEVVADKVPLCEGTINEDYRNQMLDKLRSLEIRRKITDDRRTKGYDVGYKGFKLNDHWKYSDFDEDEVREFVSTRPTIEDMYQKFGSRNLIIRLAKQFYSESNFELWQAQYLTLSNQVHSVYALRATLIEQGKAPPQKGVVIKRDFITELPLIEYDVTRLIREVYTWLGCSRNKAIAVMHRFYDQLEDLVDELNSRIDRSDRT